MTRSNNEFVIHLTLGDKIRLHRMPESQDLNAPVVWQVIWKSLRTIYHFANIRYLPSPQGRFTAELVDETGIVIAQFPLQSISLRNAALEVIETKVCF
mgnify:FL=1